MLLRRRTPTNDGNKIVIGHWLYDEKPEPELAKQDKWRKKKPPRPLAKMGDPIVVDRALLKSGHTIIRGMTGSGKTSRGMLPLILALMKPYQMTWETRNGFRAAEERDAIIVIDLGGDKQMFHATKNQAKTLGRRFRFLSLDAERSYKFDPFQSIGADGQRIIRLCNLLLEAFSLDHGIVYGGSWFSQRNLLMLLSICEELVAGRKDGREVSLREVDRYLQGPKCANIKDAEQVRGIFRFLLEYQQLQPNPEDDDVVQVKRVCEEGEVFYAYLPANSEATTARQIAGLIMQITIASAMQIYDEQQDKERPMRHVHLFVDEMVNLAGAAYENYLIGARKYSISITSCYQSSESLQKDKNVDLVPVVRDNSVLQMLYTVTGKRDIEELQTFSREDTRGMRSEQKDVSVRLNGLRAFGHESESEQITTQLTKNEILDISATEGAYLGVIKDGLGHREPIPGMGSYAISKAAFLEAKATRLPVVAPTRKLTDSRERSNAPSGPPWEVAHLAPKKTRVHRERLSRIAELLNRLEEEERFEH